MNLKKWTALACVAAAAWCTSSAQAGGKGELVAIDAGLSSRAPAHWKKQKAGGFGRMYQFAIPATKGDDKGAELIIYHFGKGKGGDVEPNLQRWKTKFEPAAGKKEAGKLTKFNVGKSTAYFLDLQGTYLDKFPPFDPNAKVQRKANYRQFAVYFDSPNGPYFFRMTGPAKTMAANEKDFHSWVKGFK